MSIRTVLCALCIVFVGVTNIGCGGGAGSAGGSSGTVVPQCSSDTFASSLYSVNTSISGQNGWYVDLIANFDEKILDVGSQACRGKGVWQLSNKVTSGGFGNQPMSPTQNTSAGESTVRDPGGGDSMAISFYIRTVSGNADGSAFTLSFSPDSADRHTYLRFVNDENTDRGFRMFAIDGAGLTAHDVKNNMTRATWMHIQIESENPDGGSNDIVRVYVDGVLVDTHTSWEDWRTALPATTLSISRVLFRINALPSAEGPFIDNQALGFYIDDFRQWTYNASNPSVHIEEYKTGFEVL